VSVKLSAHFGKNSRRLSRRCGKWAIPGIAMMPYGLLLMSVCDQDPVIETVGVAL